MYETIKLTYGRPLNLFPVAIQKAVAYLADLGEARRCSMDTFVIHKKFQSVILFLSCVYGAAKPKR